MLYSLLEIRSGIVKHSLFVYDQAFAFRENKTRNPTSDKAAIRVINATTRQLFVNMSHCLRMLHQLFCVEYEPYIMNTPNSCSIAESTMNKCQIKCCW